MDHTKIESFEKSEISHVLIVDDDINDANSVKNCIQSLFHQYDLIVKISVETKTDQVTLHLNKHPDIVICDVSLSGKQDIRGLELIEVAKEKYKHIKFAAMTSNFGQLVRLNEIELGPDFFIPKPLLLPNIDENFKTTLLSFIINNTKQNRYIKIKISTDVEKSIKSQLGWKKFDRDAIECLVRQVFTNDLDLFYNNKIYVDSNIHLFEEMESIIDTVEILPFQEGQSGSLVFKAISTHRGQPHNVSVVLKFCTLSNFFKEVSNFNKYVKWTLPQAWRVDILGTGQIGKLGVIGYSLAFAGSSDAQPLSYFLRKGIPEPINRFMSSVFDVDKKIWYKNVEEVEENIGLALSLRYIGDQRTVLAKINSIIPLILECQIYQDWIVESNSLSKADFLRDSLVSIVSTDWGGYQSCICHGDLHGANIMASDSHKNNVFIDFQDTGKFHVFTDFVFFENAIRKDGNFTWNCSLIEYLEKEKSIISDYLSNNEPAFEHNPSMSLELTLKMRTLAFQNFPREKRVLFFLHSWYITILMISQKDLNLETKERLVAFFLANTETIIRNTLKKEE